MEPCDRESLSDYSAISEPLRQKISADDLGRPPARASYHALRQLWVMPDGCCATAAQIREAARMHFMPDVQPDEVEAAISEAESKRRFVPGAAIFQWSQPDDPQDWFAAWIGHGDSEVSGVAATLAPDRCPDHGSSAMAEPQTITRAADDVKAIAARLKEIEAENAEARRQRDPDAATGAFLDRLGDENGLKRSGAESDYTFRQRVKKAIAGEITNLPNDGCY